MSQPSRFKLYLVRLGIILAISVVAVTAFDEIVFSLQKDQNERPAKTIELVIPAGTAQRVAAGQNAPGIPTEMVFVRGDQLVVTYHDTVIHQLGPLWVAPGGRASMVLNQADKFSYSCSFQSTRYLDLDVRQPLTLGTRLIATAVAAPTLASLLFIYGLLVFPIKPRPTQEVV
jgi:hypothetical protein